MKSSTAIKLILPFLTYQPAISATVPTPTTALTWPRPVAHCINDPALYGSLPYSLPCLLAIHDMKQNDHQLPTAIMDFVEFLSSETQHGGKSEVPDVPTPRRYSYGMSSQGGAKASVDIQITIRQYLLS